MVENLCGATTVTPKPPLLDPVACVWEITMGCNMRCGHCGSSCSEEMPGQLSLEEGYALIDEFSALNMRWVTLSGGEPLTHPNWPQLASRIRGKGMEVNIITNGSLITPKVARQMAVCGLSTAAISVDGTREVHDKIRMPGSYDKLQEAYGYLKAEGVFRGAITTVTKENIHLLPQLKDELLRMGVEAWQIQFGLPMGNLAKTREKVIDPEQVDELIEFCYRTGLENKIQIYPADCLGYYSRKEEAARRMAFNIPLSASSVWDGCNAGLRSFGILHNGDIVGCTSIRDEQYIEGNVKERSLRSVWYDENAFSWRRQATKSQLKGLCGSCKYGVRCLGGCANVRLTIGGDICAENRHCSYNVALNKNLSAIKGREDCAAMFTEAQNAAARRETQYAAQLLDRLLEINPNHADGLKLLGYAEFFNGNYQACLAANQRALELEPGDTYARGGLALAISRLGRVDEAIAMMESLVAETKGKNVELVNDLASLREFSARIRRTEAATK